MNKENVKKDSDFMSQKQKTSDYLSMVDWYIVSINLDCVGLVF